MARQVRRDGCARRAAENNKLKKLLAEAHLDIHALNTAFEPKR
jgi:hypothetical protein